MENVKNWLEKKGYYNSGLRTDNNHRIDLYLSDVLNEYRTEQLRLYSVVMPRISHFVSEIGQKYQADDEAVLFEIQDGNLRFYEIGYDFERIYLTPVYVA